MSTPEPSLSGGIPAVPEAALIARIANELFRAQPSAALAGLAIPAAQPDLPAAVAASAPRPLPATLPTVLPAGIAGAPGPVGGDLDVPLPCATALQELLAPAAAPLRQGGGSPYYFVARTAAPAATPGALDVQAIRRDFPILAQRVNGRPLVWLDNAATTQKPRQVIERIGHYYATENSNIHRAAHTLAARSTDAYEGARETVRRFLNARSPNEIIFVRGATEGINLVAQSWGVQHLGAGDEIVLTHLEHHANIVPWQAVAAARGAVLRVAPVDDSGQIILAEYARLLGPRTRLVALTQVSNALGTVTPAREMIAMAHAVGAKALLDGAQSVSHLPVDVQALDADWFVFSGHKVFGPTGIGAVYGKEALLNATEPWQRGGNMIRDVTFERSEFHAAPGRFEAGTGSIADAVGLGAALDYVESIGLGRIAAYEHELLAHGTRLLGAIPGLRLIGTAADKASVLSFVLDGWKTEEVGKALDQAGIAVRSGHHCAQPILRRFGVESTVRPSLAFYNTFAEVDLLATTVARLAGSRR